MNRTRFLADHDLNETIIDGTLRLEPALEFLKSRDLGLSDRPDAEVLAWAANHGFIVVSYDACQRRMRDLPPVSRFRDCLWYNSRTPSGPSSKAL